MVFQGYSLFPWLTVKKNVMFGPRMTGRSRDEAERDARLWLDLVGLSKFADAYPHQLSGGMRQRVAIARALVFHPPILLGDEPTGNLDSATGEEILRLLDDLHNEFNNTILLVTHNDLAAAFCDRILTLRDGQFVKEIRTGRIERAGAAPAGDK